MTPASRRFKDRFLSKIGKIDRRDLHEYLSQLFSHQEFLETLLDHLDEGIVVTNEAIEIILTNDVARRMLAWPRGQRFLGEPLAGQCPPGDLRDAIARMRERPREIKGYEFEFGPGGHRRIALKAFELRGQRVEDGTDAPAPKFWVFLLQDVTERYLAIENSARAQHLASLALLTSGVAHEIKNPLNSLNIHAEILQREARESTKGGAVDGDKVERATSVILEETARLTEIVNEFIQAARPASAVTERQSLNRLVEDAARVFTPECQQAGVELRVELDAELPPIDIDAHLMFQALRNLIRNAIEAHEGERAGPNKEVREAKSPPGISLRTKLAGDFALVEVADNGPGIDAENIDKIFEPYYTTKFSGTGLGLMVVYRVVSQHRGQIHVDSRKDVGTRFIISLPLTERPVRLLAEPKPSQAPLVS